MNSYFLSVTQPFNVGDLLINRMLIEELSKYGKVFVDCYNCPSDFRSFLIGNSENIIDVYKAYGFTLKKGRLLSFAKLARKEKIKLYTQSPGPLSRLKGMKKRFCFFLIYKVLAFLNIPFVRIGNCCSSAITTQTDVTSKGVSHYFVRAKNAVFFLKKYGAKNVEYIPDLAYLYYDKVATVEKKKTVIFSFREVNNDFSLFIMWLKDLIEYLKTNGYQIVFYHQVKTDDIFMKKIHSRLNDADIKLRTSIVWYDSLDFYEDKTIIVSNRLHCLLTGALYNVIPFAYVDSHRLVRKIQDVFESSFGNRYDSYISSSNSSVKISDIIDNLTLHQRYINSIVRSNNELCKSKISEIVEAIK